VPIIISTGRADEATLQRLRNLNIGGYIVKPFSPAQLKAAIFVAISRHQPWFAQPEEAGR
jgi:DNA-binding response OmpR family regulator